MAIIKVPTLHCVRCDHEWVPRKGDVRRCPSCGTAHFDVPLDGKNNGKG